MMREGVQLHKRSHAKITRDTGHTELLGLVTPGGNGGPVHNTHLNSVSSIASRDRRPHLVPRIQPSI